MRIRHSPAIAAPLLLSLPSCFGAPEQPARPVGVSQPSAPSNVISAAPPAPKDWQNRPATAGHWVYRTDGAGSVATFAGPSAGAAFTLRCDTGSRRISATRAGTAQNAMTVRTSFGSVSWPATASSSATVAIRAANDAAFDQMAYSRGRFAIEVAGSQPLILPAWGEVGRVVEDCRA